MAVNIILSVAGQGSGSGGESREFVYSVVNPTAPLVTLSIDDTSGVTSYLWEILNQPPGASTSLSSQSAASPTFTPTDSIWGTYLIRCTVIRNSVQETGTVCLSFKTPNRDMRFPAAGEKVEFSTDNGWMLAEWYLYNIVDNIAEGDSYWDRTGTILHPDTTGDTLQVGSGSASVPSYAYEADIDTGRRLYSTGVEAFLSGGNPQLLFGNDGSPYIKAVDGLVTLKIGNYKTSGSAAAGVLIEADGNASTDGGTVNINANSTAGKTSTLNLTADSNNGITDLNITADNGSTGTVSNLDILATGNGASVDISAVSATSDSTVSITSSTAGANADLTLGTVAVTSGRINIGTALTHSIRFADKYLDDSSVTWTFLELADSLGQWDDLDSNYSGETLVGILNWLYDNQAITVSEGTGIRLDVVASDSEINVEDAPASEIDFGVIAGYGPTNVDLQSMFNKLQGPTKLLSTEGIISDSGSGQIDVTALDGIVKAGDAENASTPLARWSATTDLDVTDVNVNYITADYGATPIVSASTNISVIDDKNRIHLGMVKRESTDIEFLNLEAQGTDFLHKVVNKAIVQSNFKPEYGTGIIISDTGTRNLAVTAGNMYWGLSKVLSSAFDSSGTDTWTCFYTDDSGSSWTKVTAQSQLDNTQYNDITSGLVSLSTSEYGLFWIYRNYANTDLYVLYGTDDYATQAAAEAVPIPTLVPWQIEDFSYLIGRAIVQEGVSATVDVTSVFVDEVAGGGSVSNHNLLSGLQGGTSGEYYHLTSADYIDVTNNLPIGTGAVVFGNSSGELDHDNTKFVVNSTSGFLGLNATPNCGLQVGAGIPGTVANNDDLYVGGDAEIKDVLYVTSNFEVTAGAVSTITVPTSTSCGALALTNQESTNTTAMLNMYNDASLSTGYAIYLDGDAGGGDTDYDEKGHIIWSPGSITIGQGDTESGSGNSRAYSQYFYREDLSSGHSVAQLRADRGTSWANNAYFEAWVDSNGVASASMVSTGMLYFVDGSIGGSAWPMSSCAIVADGSDWTDLDTLIDGTSESHTLVGGILAASQTGGSSVSEPAGQVVYGTGSGVDSEANFHWDATNDELTITNNVTKTNWYDADAGCINLTGTATQGTVIKSDKDLTLGNRSSTALLLQVLNSCSGASGSPLTAIWTTGPDAEAFYPETKIGASNSTNESYMELYARDASIDNYIKTYVSADTDRNAYIDLTWGVSGGGNKWVDYNAAALIDVEHATYGSSPTTAIYSSGTLTVDLSAGNKPFQSVSLTGNITALSFTNPTGVDAGIHIKIVASGSDRTISGITNVSWAKGSDLSGSGVTIPVGDWLIISLYWDGTEYCGWVSQEA